MKIDQITRTKIEQLVEDGASAGAGVGASVGSATPIASFGPTSTSSKIIQRNKYPLDCSYQDTGSRECHGK